MISTSRVERQNLTMRMCMRRLKWENLKAALALHFASYNLCRGHQTRKGAPRIDRDSAFADQAETGDDIGNCGVSAWITVVSFELDYGSGHVY
jgi:hypothetical protein